MVQGFGLKLWDATAAAAINRMVFSMVMLDSHG
jgi:hypothetical protein